MKHTSGPWALHAEQIDREGSYVEPTVWSGECHVAVIRVGLTGTLANGQLIAAAPDLLEALREMLTAIELEGSNGLRFFEARNSGLAALQKAEGCS